MTRIQKLCLPGLVLATAFLLLVSGCGDSGSSSGTTGSPSGPKLAPDFTLKSLDGDTINSNSFDGKGLVVNFAASWCGPCELEAPIIEKAYEKYKDRLNFLEIAVKDTAEDQRAFASKHGLKMPIALDPDGKVLYNFQKAGKVNMSGIPTTFFVDKDGVIQAFFIGPISESTFDQRVATILN